MKTLMLMRFDISPKPQITNAISPFFTDKPWFIASPTTMITFFHSNADLETVNNAILATGEKGVMGHMLIEVDENTILPALPEEGTNGLLAYISGTFIEPTASRPMQQMGRAIRPMPATSDRERLDQLLDKVTATGINSLSTAEQTELNTLSAKLGE